MSDPVTDKALGILKRTRTNAKEALRVLQDGTDAFVQLNDNRNLESIRKYKQSLERKWESYDKAHLVVMSSGSEDQLAKEDFGTTSEAEHNLLTRNHDLALEALQDAVFDIKERQQARLLRDKEVAKANEESRLLNERIGHLRQVLDGMYGDQGNDLRTMKDKAEAAVSEEEICTVYYLHAAMKERIKLMSVKVKELVTLVPGEFVSHDNAHLKAQLDLQKAFELAKGAMRPAINICDDRSEIYNLYPDLRPTPTSTAASTPAHSEGGTDNSAQLGPEHMIQFARTLGDSLKTAMKPPSSVKKLEPPKFTGAVADYSRWKRNWEAHIGRPQ